MKAKIAAMGVAVLLPLIAIPGTADAASKPKLPGEPIFGSVIINVDQLRQPHGLAFDKNGQLFVVESGVGGAGPCVDHADEESGEIVSECLGMSGYITQIVGNEAVRLKALPSIAHTNPDGDRSEAAGPVDIAIREDDSKVVVMSGAGSVADRKAFGSQGKYFGRVIRVSTKGSISTGVDLMDYEAKKNPDGTDINSNPFGIFLSGAKAYVADAGANTLYTVNDKGMGSVNKALVFPQTQEPAPPFLGMEPGAMIPADAVPTAVTQGSDGNLYMGQLTGFPFTVGAANVYKVTSTTKTVFATGFTNIVDITADTTGNLFVLEFSATGLLSDDVNSGRITKLNIATGTKTVIADGLRQPGGVAARGNYVYVTTCSVCTDGAAVERYDATPAFPI